VAIDLDPQPGATFSQILDCAEWVEEELDRVKVQGFPKTSGSEGLHVYIPLPPGTPYEAGMLFCQIIATMIATKHPKVATVERMVRRRKDGTFTSTTCRTFKAKRWPAPTAPEAALSPVSTPLTWKEVHQRPTPQDYDRHDSSSVEEDWRLWEKMQAQGRKSSGRSTSSARSTPRPWDPRTLSILNERDVVGTVGGLR
jgi:DNA primase